MKKQKTSNSEHSFKEQQQSWKTVSIQLQDFI